MGGAWRKTRSAAVVLCLLFLASCGEIVLEGLEQEFPDPPCPGGQVLDQDGICRPPPCEWDEDCPPGERCNQIEGRCSLGVNPAN